MANPYIDKIIKNLKKERKKKGYKFRTWIIIISTTLCVSIIAFPVFIEILEHLINPHDPHACFQVQIDAQNTLSAIASYWADPTQKDEVPTVQDLMRTEDLTIDKNSTVIIDGPIDRVRVTVINKEKRCVRGNKFEVYMGGTAGTWY
jgi:hypothetical protein